MKASEVLRDAVSVLKRSPAIDHWQRHKEEIEADELLAFVLDKDRVDPDEDVPADARRRFERMVVRRAQGEPVPLITGFAVFRGLEMIVRPGVFVPRDSTEYLAVQAIRRVRSRRRPVAVDLATGAGAVALAIANEVPGARVFGTDISARAIRIARTNADGLRLRATFVRGDLFGGLPRTLTEGVDVVTLHPPYVARGQLRELPDEIRRFEPVHTLTDRSVDGLGLIERATLESPTWLKPGGWFLVEVSPDRSRSVASVMRGNGFQEVRSTVDHGFKVTRVLVGRWPG